jgi:hypothetical protein
MSDGTAEARVVPPVSFRVDARGSKAHPITAVGGGRYSRKRAIGQRQACHVE